MEKPMDGTPPELPGEEAADMAALPGEGVPPVEDILPVEVEPAPPVPAPREERPGSTPVSLDAVYDVPVKVQAILGRTRMAVCDLVRMAPGTVVELDRKVGEPVDIFVNDRLIARGEVVMIENALGVTLTEIVREEQ